MIEMEANVDSTPETGIPLFSTNFVGERGTSGQTALYNAALGDRLEEVEMLLENGAKANSLSKMGSTPLAALLNVYTGFRPPAPASGENGTILHGSASFGNDEVIEFLLTKGIDLSLKDPSNRTALDVASGVPPVGGQKAMFPGEMAPETPIYESTMTLLTDAMNAQGVVIEEYMAPPSEEGDEESGKA